MDNMALIAKAEELVRLLGEPDRLASLGQSLAAVARLLHQQDELNEQLVSIAGDVRRVEAESASRVQKCEQREAIAQRQHHAATELRNRELTALDQRITAVKTEIAALTEARQSLRQAIEVAQAEHRDVLSGLAVAQRAATQALEATRASLAKLREAIPA